MNRNNYIIIFLVALVLCVSYFNVIDSLKYKSSLNNDSQSIEFLKGRIYAEQLRASQLYTFLWFINTNTPKNISMNITNSSLKSGMTVSINGEFYDENRSIYDYKLDGNNITLSLLARFPEERKVSFKENDESVNLTRLLFYNYTYNIHKNDVGFEIDKILYCVNYIDNFGNGKQVKGILGDKNDISNYLLDESERIEDSVIVLYEIVCL